MSAVIVRPKRGHVTLATLAQELGVSKATVSNAYNRPQRLSAELRKQIMETAERLGYSGPDPVGATLSRGRVGAIGLVFFDDAAYPLSFAFSDPAHALYLQGIADACSQADTGLVLLAGANGPRQVQTALVDGFICQYDVPTDQRIASVKARGLPMVVVDGPAVAGHPRVGVDDCGGAAAAAEHLLALGHTRLAVLLAPASPTLQPDADLHDESSIIYHVVRDRLRGYRGAVETAGLAWAEVSIMEARPYSHDAARLAAGRLLDRRQPPTALIAMTDELALGAMAAASDRGLVVPRQLSVIGFDDIPAASRARPALTTVHQPHYDKGHLAAQYLLKPDQLGGETVLSIGLVVRASTAPPPA